MFILLNSLLIPLCTKTQLVGKVTKGYGVEGFIMGRCFKWLSILVISLPPPLSLSVLILNISGSTIVLIEKNVASLSFPMYILMAPRHCFRGRGGSSRPQKPSYTEQEVQEFASHYHHLTTLKV